MKNQVERVALYRRLVSCGYDLILCAYNYAYVYAMVNNVDGYIKRMKAV